MISQQVFLTKISLGIFIVMKITESQLRRIIKSELFRLHEADGDKPAKAGTQTAEAEGTINTNKIADLLGVDTSKLKTAVTNLRAGKRNPADDKIFGDVIAKLIEASPDDTVKVMGVFKTIKSDNS